MNGLKFEWDPKKALLNIRRHRVTFEEAESVWQDPSRIEARDEKHSEMEDRWFTIGLSQRLRLVMVIYVERDEAIRIISARRANKTEARSYAGEA